MMSKLALMGGKPVRGKNEAWPSWPMSDAKDAQRLAEIVKSNRWSYDGPVEWEFADAFTKYQKGKFGMCTANGTVAIQVALEALDIGAYDEVIVPGLTWQATAAACVDVNAVPVLVDVEPDTWCLDIDAVDAAITKKTRAVIVVHLYGCMTDMDKLRSLCKKHDLYLIEDCAHQHGSFWKGTGVGALGDIGTFSFQESKVLSSGEGGFNICNTKQLFERLYSLRNCGRGYKDDMTHAVQSGNYRLTEFQAGILLGGLSRLDKQVKLRDANAQYLNARLADIPGVAPMRRRKQVTQQSYFNFAFRIDQNHFRGVNNHLFCKALNAELNMPDGFEPPYQPLNDCALYKPRTKPRHKLNADYWKAIDPKRFKLPVCKDAHEKTGCVVHHAVLMGTKKDMDQIADAVAKVSANAEALRGRRNGQSSARKKAFKSRAVW
ncbi:MAG: DegT/DnrJ/EryC1/StrS family aminotransferase [Candidatus Hydrogenedentales bacterium]